MEELKIAVLENERFIYPIIHNQVVNGHKKIIATNLQLGFDASILDTFDLFMIDGTFDLDYIVSLKKVMDERLNADSPSFFVCGINSKLDHILLENGVKGGLFDGFSDIDLMTGIASIEKKGFSFPEATTKSLVDIIVSRKEVKPLSILKCLTDRELDVIRMICDGLANKEIAKRLAISIRTVEVHRKNISKKTQTKNTASIVVYAIRNGLYKL